MPSRPPDPRSLAACRCAYSCNQLSSQNSFLLDLGLGGSTSGWEAGQQEQPLGHQCLLSLLFLYFSKAVLLKKYSLSLSSKGLERFPPTQWFVLIFYWLWI